MTRSLARYVRDARRLLITTVVFGAATSLYWIDFNLYLEAIGINGSTLGWLLATSQLAGVIVALPASAISNRIGRRTVMAGGIALVAVALFAVLPGNVPLIFVGVAIVASRVVKPIARAVSPIGTFAVILLSTLIWPFSFLLWLFSLAIGRRKEFPDFWPFVLLLW